MLIVTAVIILIAALVTFLSLLFFGSYVRQVVAASHVVVNILVALGCSLHCFVFSSFDAVIYAPARRWLSVAGASIDVVTCESPMVYRYADPSLSLFSFFRPGLARPVQGVCAPSALLSPVEAVPPTFFPLLRSRLAHVFSAMQPSAHWPKVRIAFIAARFHVFVLALRLWVSRLTSVTRPRFASTVPSTGREKSHAETPFYNDEFRNTTGCRCRNKQTPWLRVAAMERWGDAVQGDHTVPWLDSLDRFARLSGASAPNDVVRWVSVTFFLVFAPRYLYGGGRWLWTKVILSHNVKWGKKKKRKIVPPVVALYVAILAQPLVWTVTEGFSIFVPLGICYYILWRWFWPLLRLYSKFHYFTSLRLFGERLAFQERWHNRPGAYFVTTIQALRYAGLFLGQAELANLMDALDPAVPLAALEHMGAPTVLPNERAESRPTVAHIEATPAVEARACRPAVLFFDEIRTTGYITTTCNPMTGPYYAKDMGELDEAGRKIFEAHPWRRARQYFNWHADATRVSTGPDNLYTPLSKFDTRPPGAGKEQDTGEQQVDRDQQAARERNVAIDRARSFRMEKYQRELERQRDGAEREAALAQREASCLQREAEQRRLMRQHEYDRQIEEQRRVAREEREAARRGSAEKEKCGSDQLTEKRRLSAVRQADDLMRQLADAKQRSFERQSAHTQRHCIDWEHYTRSRGAPVRAVAATPQLDPLVRRHIVNRICSRGTARQLHARLELEQQTGVSLVFWQKRLTGQIYEPGDTFIPDRPYARYRALLVDRGLFMSPDEWAQMEQDFDACGISEKTRTQIVRDLCIANAKWDMAYRHHVETDYHFRDCLRHDVRRIRKLVQQTYPSEIALSRVHTNQGAYFRWRESERNGGRGLETPRLKPVVDGVRPPNPRPRWLLHEGYSPDMRGGTGNPWWHRSPLSFPAIRGAGLYNSPAAPAANRPEPPFYPTRVGGVRGFWGPDTGVYSPSLALPTVPTAGRTSIMYGPGGASSSSSHLRGGAGIVYGPGGASSSTSVVGPERSPLYLRDHGPAARSRGAVSTATTPGSNVSSVASGAGPLPTSHGTLPSLSSTPPGHGSNAAGSSSLPSATDDGWIREEQMNDLLDKQEAQQKKQKAQRDLLLRRRHPTRAPNVLGRSSRF